MGASATFHLPILFRNAPTCLAFLAAAKGQHELSASENSDVLQFVGQHDQKLVAISLGAVFFRAMTYIGNGRDFRVKCNAERMQVRTPGFVA